MMADRRQVLRALLVGAAGAAVPSGLAALGACGVPAGGHPIVDGNGPSIGTGGGPQGGKPPAPDAASTPEEFVLNYLRAVAGPLDDDHVAPRQESARAFWTGDAGRAWSPGHDTTVVRVVGIPHHVEGNSTTRVNITLQQIGTLNEFGVVSATPPTPDAVSCEFVLVPDRAQGTWRLDKITPSNLAGDMLLNCDVLDDGLLFRPQLVYYWPSTAKDGLVPDLHYLPLFGNDQNRWTRIISDLLNPPAGWLNASPVTSSTLSGLPGMDKDNRYLVVNIKASTPPPDPARLMALMTQLRASLYPVYGGGVQLQINSQQPVTSSDDGFHAQNLADSPGQRSEDAFCVAGGAVSPLGGAAVPPVLNSPSNKDVLLAGLNRDKSMVAVVRSTKPGQQGLWIGDSGTGADYIRCQGLPTTGFGRPVWLPGQAGLVVLANGHLYAVDRVRGTASAVDITPVGVQRVQAFSIAPDGRRIALIADGWPQVASLSPTDKTIQVGTQLRIDIPNFLLAREFTAIAWSRLERVVVAGRLPNHSFGMVEATIDGVIIRQIPNLNLEAPINRLSAYPPAPPPPGMPAASMGRILGEADTGKNAYSFEYLRAFRRLDQVQVTPSPSPSASASASPHPQAATPLAPFFAD